MRQTYEHYRDDWNERRKRLLLLGALRRPHYQRAFEPGCAFGNLSALLAPRCGQLIATDHDGLAVARARELLAHLDNVYVCTMRVPRQWPGGRFDLIVLGELLNYLPREEVRCVADQALRALEPNGEIVACHWRHRTPETGLGGDEVHAELHAALPLQHCLRHQEADFILETWSLERSTAKAGTCAA